MKNADLAPVLRLLGPLVEVACIALLFRYPDDRVTVVGVPLPYLLYLGIAGGLVMVVAGLAMTATRRRPD